MKALFSSISSLLLILLLITACGGQSLQQEATVGETESAMNADGTCIEGFRLFAHKLLATEPLCVSEEPERIIAFEPFEILMSLEAPPIATFSGNLENYAIDFPALADDIENIGSIGVSSSPNIEAIVAANPDLIIGTTQRWRDMYEDLSAIAPTALYDFTHSGQWKEVAEFVADVTNQQTAYESLLQNYEERVSTLREELANSGLSISVVRVLPTGVRLYVLDSFSGEVIDDIGLARPESQQYTHAEMLDEFQQPSFYNISDENLQLADADVIFSWTLGATPEIADQAREQQLALRDDPLWSTLNAVQNDNVYEVGGYWIGLSFVAAHYMLDDLYEHVLDTEPTTPNPFVHSTESGENEGAESQCMYSRNTQRPGTSMLEYLRG
ncbi:MAG: ABC-type Fe3+-hydroxamate transport system, periplasmic component [Chloroflexi bacterium AL-W]|nr:ABC-type Fe3+-hydroxamate transport system, periplasmic component [Chloroflexi bacterium AL-N1]NOK70755.1 ABC-type Fe3+-hydroxamate transport system, periplasmic component [Chloroflexi bacterium AL-N10]NOK78315.1 ABC-type Fe3+-hydroxamate transport system, periplasmic component [Chloroflexi bacterium AL-N5]NOK85658.1 ABC-type Fe3+-hydroxamate transport system, periplasmic component [Chloroflexi bacterium AL-W]NOK92572.1 ABC-type Fe3+-hydroxamate transport system, periplasmic component [Chlor